MAENKPIARRLLLGGGLAVGAAAAAGYVLYPGAEPTQTQFATATAQTTGSDTGDDTDGVKITDMVMGAADAPIEVIEYGSFTCPHCARFHVEVYPLLKANFIETGKIRFIYREVYFDRPGLWAGLIARCGGPERYFGLTELIMQRQSEWSRLEDAPSIISALFGIGRLAGLDDDTMKACVRDDAMAKALFAYYQETSSEHGITATPSFVINGEKMSNMGYPEFERVLNEILEG